MDNELIPMILTALSVIAIAVSITVVYKKRKRAGITGIKSALTSVSLILIALTNILAYWFDFLGIISWTISIFLLIAGAYFTKYLPAETRE